MRILLDTHIFLWWDSAPRRLPQEIRAAIQDRTNDVCVSAAAVWEIAVKRAGGKLSFGHAVVVDAVVQFGFELVSISGAHAEYAGGLPRHHNDPFDRLMIAQAYLEGMVLATRDRMMRPYGIPLLGLR